jgi:hypothetical protein
MRRRFQPKIPGWNYRLVLEIVGVRTEAFVSDCGAAVVFLFRVSGYVDICHITPVMERPRSDVRFAENRDVTR